MPFKRLLASVDESPASLHALRAALDLAGEHGAALTAVAVAPPYQGDLRLVGVSDIRGVLRKPCEQALEAAAGEAARRGLPLATTCEEGEPGQAIADLADSLSADLIVMGRRNTSTMGRLLLGSVTARTIGFSRADVLIVPEGAAVNLRRLVLATDGSRFALEAARKAMDLAWRLDSSLDVVTVVDLPNEYLALAPQASAELTAQARAVLNEAVSLAHALGVSARGTLLEGNAAEAILEHARQGGPGVLILASHGRTGLRRLLMGGVVEWIVAHTDMPVWITKG
ncbi:Stress response protein NhaX [Fundidesulfovibrio magnetotacticus]|uniref:Stress response protein NhaX n=1 Tax=Fundidesulfovibrio magnetotacticus TaxID=2730080 RepID=A0A6V8LY72_9BACT|nr:universal stress protein [Fundidesulfovibrio magnetotacticus]GFK94597.1 Stress response protein NhaX [Fundidesulfovibrio magnetotacticus]